MAIPPTNNVPQSSFTQPRADIDAAAKAGRKGDLCTSRRLYLRAAEGYEALGMPEAAEKCRVLAR